MHHFFVTPENVNVDEKKIVITGSDVNHIKNVLRMKIGEELLISDGDGQDYMCEVEEFTDYLEVIAKINETQFQGTELPSKIFLFQGLPKSDKMELIIQKAVELGAFEIIPVATKRAIVKLDKKKEQSKINRWKEISKSAAKQSRRSIIPNVTNVMSFKEAMEYAKSLDINLIPYENYKDMQGTKIVIDEITKGQSIGIFIGPEGGFADEEVELAVSNDVKRISLGKRILRTETAGLMIISVLMYNLEE